MNTKATAAAIAIAAGAAIITAAAIINNTNQPQPQTPKPTAAQPQQPKIADLFSLPTSPSPAKVFFQTAEGKAIPARARRDSMGMMSMMASLVDRMNEFDANGDGMLDDLERLAMGVRLRKEFLSQYDLDGDGDMSREEWRALQRSMFEQTPQGQRLMAQFDLDADGRLNEQEQAALDAHLAQQQEQQQAEERARMDTNNDGEVSEAERRAARQQEREFWQSQMAAAENNFDHDGDGELNIEESRDAWDAWVEYQTVDDFINRYDTDGNNTMGPADYDQFLSDYERRRPAADVNNDGEINVQDINAYRDLVLRSRSVS